MKIKQQLRLVFSPVLDRLETGNDLYAYKPLQRKVLIFIGCLFCGLSLSVIVLGGGKDIGYLLPVFVFGITGLLALIVGVLGTDRAVAKIWGTK